MTTQKSLSIPNTALMTFVDHGNAKGHLTAVEGGRDIPFAVERIYYITQVAPSERRGFHSHRDLEQVLICLHGSVRVLVKTPELEEVVTLDSPTKGLYIGPMIWREMFDFSPGSVLLVLASRHYHEDDYIRDYQQYETEANSYFKPWGDNYATKISTCTSPQATDIF